MNRVLAEEKKIVAFLVDGKEYAMDVRHVLSIEKMLPITRVPNVPDYIKGVINLRGLIIPVINLRKRFGMKEIAATEDTRIVITEFDGKQIGFIVDSANDVVEINPDDIGPQPETVGNDRKDFIEGIIKLGERLIILLDLEKILQKNEVGS